MNAKSLKIWLGASLVLSVAAAPFLAQGNQKDQKTRQLYAEQISRMSDSQRARLAQNEAIYRAATPAEKAALQEMHAALVRDQQSGGGELNAVMQRYDAWLKTIQPYQREQLDKTHDPKQRIALMQEIVRNQREWTARRNMPFSGAGGERPVWDLPPMLDEKSLANVMNALQQAADPRLSDAQRAELAQLQGIKRDFRLLRYLKDFGTGLNSKPLLESPPKEFQEVAANIAQYVSNERIQKFVTGRRDDGQPEWGPPPEARLAGLISQSLVAELVKLRRGTPGQMNAEKLEQFLDTLSAERQYELLALEASDFQIDLRNQYLDSEGIQDLPTMHDVRELFGRFPGPRGGPGGDRGPFGFGGHRENRGPRGGNGDGRGFDKNSGRAEDEPGRPERGPGGPPREPASR